MDMRTISRSDLNDLKELYKEAVEKNRKQLIFKKQPVKTGYAKYLIVYLNRKFNI